MVLGRSVMGRFVLGIWSFTMLAIYVLGISNFTILEGSFLEKCVLGKFAMEKSMMGNMVWGFRSSLWWKDLWWENLWWLLELLSFPYQGDTFFSCVFIKIAMHSFCRKKNYLEDLAVVSYHHGFKWRHFGLWLMVAGFGCNGREIYVFIFSSQHLYSMSFREVGIMGIILLVLVCVCLC